MHKKHSSMQQMKKVIPELYSARSIIVNSKNTNSIAGMCASVRFNGFSMAVSKACHSSA